MTTTNVSLTLSPIRNAFVWRLCKKVNQMLRFCFTNLLILFCLGVSAQSSQLYSYGKQDPQFTQYMFNTAFFNPAVAGEEEAWVSTLNVRNQWVNLPGAPVSQILTSHVPIYKISSGAGLIVTNDISGQLRNTGVKAIYAYHKRFRSSTLSFGLSAGFTQQQLNGAKLVSPTGNYEGIVDHNDPNLPVTLSTEVLPDASAGIYFFGKNLKIGASATHLLLPLAASKETAVTDIQYNPNAYVYVGYDIDVTNSIGFTPSVLYKTDLTESMVDVNALFTFNNNILAGASFRGYINNQFDAVALVAGLNLADNWRVSYSYDITTSALNTVSSGSHEIVLRYSIPVARPRAGKMINNPRYLYH